MPIVVVMEFVRESMLPHGTVGAMTRARGAGRRHLMAPGAYALLSVIIAVTAISVGADGDGLAFAAAAVVLSFLVAVLLGQSGRALRVARAELAEEHRQLERMFMEACLGMAMTDDTRRWVRVNPALCRMLGYSQEELVGRDPMEFTHPDDRDMTRDRFARLHREQGGTELEKRYVARDGSVITASLTVSATHDRETGRTFHVAQIQDISARKRVEMAYAAERELLDAFLDNIPEQVYFKDLESRFLRVSKPQATKLGFERPEELIGKTDFDVFAEEHARQAFADEQEIIRTGRPIIDQEEREAFSGDAPSGRPARDPAWVLTTKLPLHDNAGDVIGTFGISRDITRRKQAEFALTASAERWRALLGHLQEIVILVDAAGVLTYATPSIGRWLGYSPDALVGTAIRELGHPDDSELMRGVLQSVTTDAPVAVTHRIRHADGSWHTLESTVVNRLDDPVMGAVLIASTDVTNRVELEAERERLDLERRVSHRLEAVGQLAAGIAHEINTPLQFVGDSLTFLKDAVEELLILTGRYRELLWIDTPLSVSQRREIMVAAEDEADVEYLLERIPSAFERTADGVARVRSIVQAMKRFSHASSTESAPADLNEALETTLAVCRNEYKYVAEVSLALGEVPPVTCNVGELNQVFLNLIINAAQAIEEHVGSDGDSRGEIRIETALDGEHVVITIADNGPGIPAELQERIYEPFFTTKTVGKGTGQGLALARSTILHHGGSLECQSAPREGTCFTIRLPLEPPATAA